MNKITISVPQLGEGLHEAKIVRHLKKPGESVRRDEPLFQMETDKALVEIESSSAGVVGEWLCSEGDVLEIGAPVVVLEAPQREIHLSSGEGHRAFQPDDSFLLKSGPSWPGALNLEGPPSGRSSRRSTSEPAGRETCSEGVWSEISPEQAALIRNMSRVQSAIPATVEKQVRWPHMRAGINEFQKKHGVSHVTMFEFFALAVSRAAAKHPRFRSHIVGNGLCIHDTLDLGVAVALPNDELTTAVVGSADMLTPAEFFKTLRSRVRAVRKGDVQVNAMTQLHLSSLGSLGIDFAIPILVPPSIGTIFLGTPSEDGDTSVFNIALTFDHRAINGVGAALFMRDLAAMLVSGEALS